MKNSKFLYCSRLIVVDKRLNKKRSLALPSATVNIHWRVLTSVYGRSIKQGEEGRISVFVFMLFLWLGGWTALGWRQQCLGVIGLKTVGF